MTFLGTNTNKIFIIDTNVILYDYRCIYSFQEHNVVIPITVLEEIDKFKRGNEIINYNAREVTRELDHLGGDSLMGDGIRLDTGGLILISTDIRPSEYLSSIFWEDKPDHRILSVAYNLAREHGSDRVALVSKDINLRMKAKAIGINAEDYETGKIQNIDELYKGKRRIENAPDHIIEELYTTESAPLDGLDLNIASLYPNEYLIVRNTSRSALAMYSKEENTLKLVLKQKGYGIMPRNAEQTFALDALMNPDIVLVTLSGKAGTGKTLMALAAALEVRKYYRQIYLARPIVPLSNRDLGYLPGDVKSKLEPYMQPLHDNLSVIQNQYDDNSSDSSRINDMLNKEKLVITPLAYIRGRNLSKIFFIIDEAQNLTPHEVKTIITRAGEGTKVVFTGDPYQIDTPYLDSRSNGLTYLIDKMKGQNLYAHVTLEKGERSRLAELASNLL
jgi:PhoH-like ATPase